MSLDAPTKIDLAAFSSNDIQQVDNEVIKGMLQRVKKQLEEEAHADGGIMNHSSHVNFYSAVATA
jgi:hypothetical protein